MKYLDDVTKNGMSTVPGAVPLRQPRGAQEPHGILNQSGVAGTGTPVDAGTAAFYV